MSVLWLGEERGCLVDWVTQLWVRSTGRACEVRDDPWLAGPHGSTRGIGRDFFQTLAGDEGLAVLPASPDAGLMPSFGALAGPGFDPGAVHPAVRNFYEHTGLYTLDMWSEWSGIFQPFGRLLAALFSRRLQQMNVPLNPLTTSRGMSSEIVRLAGPAGALRYTGWVRGNPASGLTVYVGAYSLARIPGHAAPCVKVVFPLPNGNATVVMKPSAHEGGILLLESAGRWFGDPGFYFVVWKGPGAVWVRHLRTFRESIRAYADESGEVRADHVFTLWRRPFLRLHYRLRRVSALV